MSLIEKIFGGIERFLDPTVERKTITTDVSIENITRLISPEYGSGYKTDADILYALENNPVFSACVYKIAEAMGGVRWELFIGKNSSGKSVGRKAYDMEQLKPVPETHPFFDLVDNGLCPEIPGRLGWILTYAWWLSVGICFWGIAERKNKADNGYPTLIYPMPPTMFKRHENGKYYFIDPTNSNKEMALADQDVIVWRNPSAVSPYTSSKAVGKTLNDELYISENSAKLQGAFFRDGGMPPAIISPESTDVRIDTEDFKKFRDYFKQKMRGFGKQYEPYFTTAPVKVMQLSSTFKDLQLSELQKDHRDNIIMAFGMSKEMLGIIDNSNRATISAAMYMFLESVVRPKIDIFVSYLQSRLLPMYDPNLVIWYKDFVPEDREFKLQVMTQHQHAFSRDEIRALAGFDPGEGPDYYMMPLTMIPETKEASGQFRKLFKKRISEDQLALLLKEITDFDLKDATETTYREVLVSVMKSAFEEVGVTGGPDAYSRAVTNYLENKATRQIVMINETTRQQVENAVKQGINEFWDTDTLADEIGKVFDVTAGRLKTIARTETHSTQSFGVVNAYKESGLVQKQRWIHHPELSADPRDTHSAMDGQVVGLGEYFNYGGLTAEYPGGFGIAAEDINCHCTIAAIIDEEDLERYESRDVSDALWTKRRNEALKYEEKMEKAYAKGIRKQKEKVMEALRRLT